MTVGSIIALSNNTMNTSKFSHGNIVLVKGQAGKSTVLIILRNDELEDGIAQVDHVVRDNLRVASGDSIWIYPCLDIEPVGISIDLIIMLTIFRPSVLLFVLFRAVLLIHYLITFSFPTFRGPTGQYTKVITL